MNVAFSSSSIRQNQCRKIEQIRVFFAIKRKRKTLGVGILFRSVCIHALGKNIDFTKTQVKILYTVCQKEKKNYFPCFTNFLLRSKTL